jgi:hypothetical protein
MNMTKPRAGRNLTLFMPRNECHEQSSNDEAGRDNNECRDGKASLARD